MNAIRHHQRGLPLLAHHVIHHLLHRLSPFLCSGAEAIDNAIKIARSFTGRPNIIAFDVRDLGGGRVYSLGQGLGFFACARREGVHIPFRVYDILLNCNGRRSTSPKHAAMHAASGF